MRVPHTTGRNRNHVIVRGVGFAEVVEINVISGYAYLMS